MASELPRASILEQSLAFMRLIELDSIDEAIELSNDYAPEHLIMNCDGAESMYIDGSTTYTHISFMDKRYVGTRMVAFYDEPTSSHTVTHAEPMEEYPMHIHWKMWFTPATNSELYRDGPPPSGVGQSVVYPLVTQSAGDAKGGYLNTTACEM